jgi:hypothetical protein
VRCFREAKKIVKCRGKLRMKKKFHCQSSSSCIEWCAKKKIFIEVEISQGLILFDKLYERNSSFLTKLKKLTI